METQNGIKLLFLFFKADLGNFALGLARDLKQRHLFELENRRHDIGRETLDGNIEIPDVAIVESARRLDLILGVGQFALKLDKIGRRFQVGVALRHREQAFQGLGQGVLLLDLFFRGLGAHRRGPGFGNPFENPAFMGRVSLNGLHQIRDEVVPAFQLHINIRPCFLSAVFKNYQAIVLINQTKNTTATTKITIVTISIFFDWLYRFDFTTKL